MNNKKAEFLTFNDGVCKIKGKNYRFGNRTIGFNRHYAAKAAGTQVNKMIHILYTDEDLANEKVYIKDTIYMVEQAQPTKLTCPPCTVLSLRRYSINRNEH
ncbi:MAG: hypothetical protein KBT46_08935 [Ruminococcus sp.]|nr:hypothetical protein [Candidatus Copronaster equi]